jgi:hypothetical protein
MNLLELECLSDLSQFFDETPGLPEVDVIRSLGLATTELVILLFCSLWRGLPVRLCPSCITDNGGCTWHTSSQALGRVMALFCAMQEQWRGESSSQQFCPLQRCWRRSEGFSLLSEERRPKDITPMRRRVVACLAPPRAAFGRAVLSACVRLKSLDREESVSVYYLCLLEDARHYQAGHQGV